MIHTVTLDKNELVISERESLRYLGYGNKEADGNVDAMIKRALKEVGDVLSLKACYDRFPIKFGADSRIEIGQMTFFSSDLKKNLCDCHEAFVFVATIGFGADRLIRKYSLISPSYTVAVQAVGTAAIEEWCDILCERFADEADADNLTLRPRFSPGYGDLSLNVQKDIFRILDCERKIGVSLTESLMMLPVKSVSAVVGIRKNTVTRI